MLSNISEESSVSSCSLFLKQKFANFPGSLGLQNCKVCIKPKEVAYIIQRQCFPIIPICFTRLHLSRDFSFFCQNLHYSYCTILMENFIGYELNSTLFYYSEQSMFQKIGNELSGSFYQPNTDRVWNITQKIEWSSEGKFSVLHQKSHELRL